MVKESETKAAAKPKAKAGANPKAAAGRSIGPNRKQARRAETRARVAQTKTSR